MDVRRGPWSLLLAWALLDGLLCKEETPAMNGCCEQQLRYRHSSAETGGPWISTLALLSSIGAVWLFVFYSIRCLCARRNPCGQEPDVRSEKPWEETREACPEEDMEQPSSYRSQVLVPAQPKCGSYPPSSNPALQAYTHQLACMEHELEHFLCEVRNQQGALGGSAGEKKEPPKLKTGSDKLRITVYEIAECEQPGRTWARGRKRKVK